MKYRKRILLLLIIKCFPRRFSGQQINNIKHRKCVLGVALLVTVMMLSLLGGCAKKFDAAGYTKAVLDLSFKDKTEQYVKMTKSTKEQAEKIYSDNLDGVMNQFLSLKLSKELTDNYRQFFNDLIKEVKMRYHKRTFLI